jgi:beta-glucosidase
MRAFEGALCEGGAMGVMTSFNRLGTRFSSANYNLVHNVLKGEWAFKGHTTTDGYTQSGFKMHFEEEAAAGIDYTCASNSDYGDAVKSYIEAGDGYMLECLRNITKHNLYALSRTFIQNGLSSNTAIVTIVPWWETTLLAVTAVSAVVLMICVILMAVWNHEKKQPKKKEA